MRNIPDRPLRITVYCVAFLVVVATGWVVTQILLAAPIVFYSVVAALLLTAVLMPLVDRFQRAGAPRWAGALTAVVLMLTVVFGTLTLVVSRAVSQVSDLRGNLRQRIVDFLGEVSPGAGAGAAMAVEVLSGMAIAVFLVFFLLKDGPRMVDWGRSWACGRRASSWAWCCWRSSWRATSSSLW